MKINAIYFGTHCVHYDSYPTSRRGRWVVQKCPLSVNIQTKMVGLSTQFVNDPLCHNRRNLLVFAETNFRNKISRQIHTISIFLSTILTFYTIDFKSMKVQCTVTHSLLHLLQVFWVEWFFSFVCLDKFKSYRQDFKCDYFLLRQTTNQKKE